jgi:uncharacterized protein YjbI with pentapeptide repeats
LTRASTPRSEPAPPIPERKPRQDDDEPLGVSFLRTRVSDDLSGLTLPRTFFGRSEISEASFRGTDLHESTLCSNDFIDVDFSQAILTGADLRASLFECASFAEADLALADLRISTFTNYVFDRASMKGTILTRRQERRSRCLPRRSGKSIGPTMKEMIRVAVNSSR